jgi:hypothetical protein
MTPYSKTAPKYSCLIKTIPYLCRVFVDQMLWLNGYDKDCYISRYTMKPNEQPIQI